MIFIRHLDRFLPNRQIFRPAHLPSLVSAAQPWRLGGVSINLPADAQEGAILTFREGETEAGAVIAGHDGFRQRKFRSATVMVEARI